MAREMCPSRPKIRPEAVSNHSPLPVDAGAEPPFVDIHHTHHRRVEVRRAAVQGVHWRVGTIARLGLADLNMHHPMGVVLPGRPLASLTRMRCRFALLLRPDGPRRREGRPLAIGAFGQGQKRGIVGPGLGSIPGQLRRVCGPVETPEAVRLDLH
jgi:hypothetical protein